MNLRSYLQSLPPTERKRLALRAKTTVAYLYQVAGGHRAVGPKLALAIEQVSGGCVTRHELRPDIFGKAA
jgi:DNA-binding transcriptional regulator YdaS (Cro superfamily)